MIVLGYRIGAQAQGHFVRVCHRLHALGVNALHFLHQRKHIVELLQILCLFRLSQTQAGKLGNFFDIVQG